jgi:hypothetical protein
VEVGDLVRAKANFLNVEGWRNNKDKAVGLVIDACSVTSVTRVYMSFKVKWSDDYGTFWSDIRGIEVINEGR